MHENGTLLARTVSLKSHLGLTSHLFQKRLGLAHALLGVQGGAESLSYRTIEKGGNADERASPKGEEREYPQWAEGLYYTSGLITEVLLYHDEEAIYFEHKGEDTGIVRIPFEMLEGLKMVEEENGHSPSKHLGE